MKTKIALLVLTCSIAAGFTAPPARAKTIALGELQMAAPGHPTRGKVSVVRTNGQRYLVLGEDFSTVAGPDLRVAFYAGDARSAQSVRYVELGVLRELAGQQVYVIPPELSLEMYRNVAIWCRQFDVLFGVAALQPRHLNFERTR